MRSFNDLVATGDIFFLVGLVGFIIFVGYHELKWIRGEARKRAKFKRSMKR